MERQGGGAGWRYGWDGFDRLIRAEDGRGLVVRFAYDPLGRRIRKEVESGATLRITRYVWAGEQLIREIETGTGDGWQDRAAQQIRDYAYWPDSHTPLFQRDAAGIYHYHLDPIGTPVRLTDTQGRVVWEAERSAFGAMQVMVAGRHQPLRLPGQYHDAETGLHYNRHRYYDPALGRYLGRDPMGAAGGVNLYAYVGNDPVNRADPSGLMWWQMAVSAVAAIAVAVAVVMLAPVAAPALAVALVAGAAAGAVGFGLNEALTQKEFCASCILLAMLKGAAVGALAAVPFLFVPAAAGYAVYAGVGAISGFVSYVADWGIDNLAGKDRPWSWKEAGISTGLGLVAGPAGKFIAARLAPGAAAAEEGAVASEAAEAAKPAKPAVPEGEATAPAEPRPVTGETDATATGKEVHARLAEERRASGDFDLVNEPITDAQGNAIEVPKRVNLKTGEAADDRVQIARPDAVRYKNEMILDDKPMGRPIAKDRQEVIRFIDAYSQSQGKLPAKIAIQRYDPVTGEPVVTELYTPKISCRKGDDV